MPPKHTKKVQLSIYHIKFSQLNMAYPYQISDLTSPDFRTVVANLGAVMLCIDPFALFLCIS